MFLLRHNINSCHDIDCTRFESNFSTLLKQKREKERKKDKHTHNNIMHTHIQNIQS